MSNNQLTEEQQASRRTLGGWFLGVGIVLLLFGLYISAFLVPDVIRTMSGPQPMTLAEAANAATTERTYARLEGGSWECDTLTPVEGLSPSHRRYEVLREEIKTTEIFFTDAAREVVAFVTLSGEVECDELSEELPSGYLYAMSTRTRQELTDDARLARYTDASHFLEFCGYCGRDNSMIGAVFGIVFTLGGGAMVVSGRNFRKTSAMTDDDAAGSEG